MPNPSPESSARSSRLKLGALALLVVVFLAAIAGAFIYWRLQQPERRVARAMEALEAKQYDVVRQELDLLQEAEGVEPERHFLQGALLLHEGKLFPALEEFGHSVEYPPLRVQTLTMSGEALYRAARYQDAIRLLNQAAEADPAHIDAHRWLASAYYDLGLHPEARMHLLEVSELDRTDPRPHRLIGLIDKDFEAYDVAVASYRESLRRDPHQPDDEEIRLELAECEIKIREYDLALKTLQTCPPSDRRGAMEAECLYSQGKVAEAERTLKAVLEKSPTHLNALLLLGAIQLETGESDAAIQTLTQAITAYPKDYTARFRLVQAYRRAGENEQADQHAAVAEQLKATRIEFSELHQTAADQPDNAEVRCRLARLAIELDRPDLAVVWYQAALAIDPTNQEARQALAR